MPVILATILALGWLFPSKSLRRMSASSGQKISAQPMLISRPIRLALGSLSACRSEDVKAEVLHATSIAINGCGVLIRGAPGSGKSSLALQLMALGGVLIADDRTHVSRDGGRVILLSLIH